MRHRIAAPDTDPHSWTCSETVDEESAVIRVRGRVDRLGADLLRGTIENLVRRGHEDITVAIGASARVDPIARAVLAAVAGRLASRNGRLRIEWADDGPSEELTAP
jgi:hypothetical protein